MRGLDVDAAVGQEVPRGTDVRRQVTGRKAIPRLWSKFTQFGVVGNSSPRLSAVLHSRDHRPRVRVRGRFAGEVAGVELCDGSLEVVEVEQTAAPSARRH